MIIIIECGFYPIALGASGVIDLAPYGQINRGVLLTQDGNNTNLFHVDNDNSATRIGVLGTAPELMKIKAGARLELEFQSNDSNRVSQNNKNGVGDNHFRKRHLDLFFESEHYGKLSMGYGDTASNGSAEMDLSGTEVIGYSSVADMAGGHFFYNGSANGLSSITVDRVFDNLDGLGRDDRLRYDSPNFSGLRLSLSNVSGGGYDLAVRYGASLGEFNLSSAVAFADPGNSSNVKNSSIDGSISVLHAGGLNATLAAGKAAYDAAGKKDGKYFYAKGGYQQAFFQIGLTSLAMDLGLFFDMERTGDTAKAVGLMLVQNIDYWSTEFYIGGRNYTLDRRNIDLNDIKAVLAGFRLKF